MDSIVLNNELDIRKCDSLSTFDGSETRKALPSLNSYPVLSTQGFLVDHLSEKEARILEDGLIIEWCDVHKGFHCLNYLEAAQWLYELRRD